MKPAVQFLDVDITDISKEVCLSFLLYTAATLHFNMSYMSANAEESVFEHLCPIHTADTTKLFVVSVV